jgi:hypothetical protein
MLRHICAREARAAASEAANLWSACSSWFSIVLRDTASRPASPP